MSHKKGNASAQQGVEIFARAGRPDWANNRNMIWAAIALVVIIGGIFWLTRPHNSGDVTTNMAAQHTLEISLPSALDTDNQQVVNITGQLLEGVKAGRFHESNDTLAAYHLDRATAFLALQQYAKVAPESAAAAKLDSTTQLAALQYEFEARYKLGERQQLVPLVQQLMQLEQSSQDPLRSSAVAGYQQDITALQNNKDISF